MIGREEGLSLNPLSDPLKIYLIRRLACLAPPVPTLHLGVAHPLGHDGVLRAKYSTGVGLAIAVLDEG
jgi:hypothetical protein